MYPDNAVHEFYPAWLIADADKVCRTLAELHAYCTPRFRALNLWDIGPEAGRRTLKELGFN